MPVLRGFFFNHKAAGVLTSRALTRVAAPNGQAQVHLRARSLSVRGMSSCCEGAKDCGTSTVSSILVQDNNKGNGAVTHEDVSEYYGKQVKQQTDLKTSACLLKGGLSSDERKLLGNVHEEILQRFYGCGSPIPPLLKGLTILDLGCGTGRDVYLAAQLVGEEGAAIGVDMTDEQLEVANKYVTWHQEKFGFAKPNTFFHKGLIEDLKSAGIADSSVDVVISNCVINLAPDKSPVLREIARVLKPGGELFFSDVFADRRIPEHLRKDKVLFGECLSGALYTEDFRRLMAKSGLPLWGVVSSRQLDVENPDISKQLGDIGFFEATIRAIKLDPLFSDVDGDVPEDYGQVAMYKGGIPEKPDTFALDVTRTFPTGTTVPVDSATAAMLMSSRYSPYFSITSPKGHIGTFKKWKQFPASVPGQSSFTPKGVSGGAGTCGSKKAEKAGGCC